MRHRSQGRLRVLCLGLLALGALACGEGSGQGSSADVPEWARDICERWTRRDGSCDQAALIADFEECQRTRGVPELERLRAAGARARMRLLAMERMTNLCLDQRGWAITEKGRASRMGGSKDAEPSS